MTSSSAVDIFTRRYISDWEIQSTRGRKLDDKCDIVDFLAVVQYMGLDLLPIKWQSHLAPTGEGATSKINVSLINAEKSFAFKCVSERQRQMVQTQDISVADVFRTLINEVLVLAHHRFQGYPTLASLQGICWDIRSDNEVWPVLVFEKSEFGDLHGFLMSTAGRKLGPIDRLQLCSEIGCAIADMHSLGKIF
jgi:hypothetical protein